MNCKVWKSCWQNIKYTLYGRIAWGIFALPCWRALEVIVENSKYFNGGYLLLHASDSESRVL
jgi:hypothetical protein